MTIRQFVKMWKSDYQVEDMILMEEKKHPDGVIDRLYHVLYRFGRGSNGRHEALRVRIGKDKQVGEHEIFNLHGPDWGKKDARLDPDNNAFQDYYSQINGWFTQWSSTYSTGSGTGSALVYAGNYTSSVTSWALTGTTAV